MTITPQNIIPSELTFGDKVNKRIILLILFGIAVSIILAVTLIVTVVIAKKEPKICVTPACLQASCTILENLDPTVDPCDNFFQFACGNFLRTAVIPEGAIGVGLFTTTAEKMQNQVKLIYEEPLPKNASRPFVYLKTVYDLCTDIIRRENEGIIDANAYFKKLGGWPLLEGSNWNESNFAWDKMIYKLRNLGGPHGFFITTLILRHPTNHSRWVICLDDTPIKIKNNLLKGFNDTMVQAFYNYMVDIAIIYGANNITAQKELKDVVEFKMKLAKVLEETNNITKSIAFQTIKQIQKDIPKLNWLEYIQNVVKIPGYNITENEEIVLRVPQYVKNLLVLLAQTPKRVIANYILVENADAIIPHLTRKLKIRRAEFYKMIGWEMRPIPIANECRIISYLGVGLQVDHLYVIKHFDRSVKDQVEELVREIQKEFVDILKKVDWLDNPTRAHAIEKLRAMKQYVAYPTELLDPNNVDAYYKKMELNSTNYLTAIGSVKRFLVDEEYSRLRNPLNRTHWLFHTTPLTVNAYYDGLENSINFPAGILQGVFYSKDRPNYMNYGILGFIIGHEMTHGFDDRGRTIDKDGNISNWWSEKTKQLFVNKSQCIIDQYNNYTYKELNLTLNGVATQGENIADNGAVREAYYAYNRWVKTHGEEPQLPGLNYNTKQLFWISSAQLWCSKYDNNFVRRMMKEDSHPPSEFRVIGPFSNSKDFNKDFKCPVGSLMNRKNKCSVW